MTNNGGGARRTDSLEVEEHSAGDEECDEAEGVAAHVDDLGVVGVGGGGGGGGPGLDIIVVWG